MQSLSWSVQRIDRVRKIAERARQLQEEKERRRQVREVAYDLQRRVKQELAFPAVIHFYCWLLQGNAALPCPCFACCALRMFVQ